MSRKSLGHVELEWTCPFCGHKNPGHVKICGSCNAPQPEDVAFERAEGAKIIEEETAVTDSGPDIHCPYCGTRNPAKATVCSQCGGDLTEGTKRKTGQVIGAYSDAPAPDVTCPYCGTPNPATALRCQNCSGSLADKAEEAAHPQPKTKSSRSGVAGALILIGLLVLCGIFALLLFRTEEINGRVTDIMWERTIVIEALGPATFETWRDEIPADASIGACTERIHHVQDEPAPNAEEICGTPYIVDEGTGFGEVVQDCQYQVYADWCEYTVNIWQAVTSVQASGHDLSPQWPALQLQPEERAGERTESYTVVFDVDGEQFTYHPNTADEFVRFTPGSRWHLEVNQLGGVVAVQPANE
ncbi:MAG: zinc ribbon domain-containing protein [Chloroflexi bacterium]|nr:MAG: zinc ribbon domain-containing protein [Chloroflexota bacterium]